MGLPRKSRMRCHCGKVARKMVGSLWYCTPHAKLMEREQSTKYPDVEVQLSGEDGNAFFIIGRVTKALRRAGVPHAKINEFVEEAMSGNYDNLLQTCMRWVSVE